MSPDCYIPRHVTGLYVFTVVNLLALLHVSVVNGDVTVYDTLANSSISYFYDMTAQFGGKLTDEGITGYLMPVYPVSNSCSHWTPAPPINKSFGADWIALIGRNGKCKFDEMVLRSQNMGYSCVIVHNSEGEEGLLHMGGSNCEFIITDNGIITFQVYRAQLLGYDAVIVRNYENQESVFPMPGSAYASQVTIPSVFVGWTDGKYLTGYQYNYNKGRYKVNVNRHAIDFKPYLLWPFAVVVGTCFVLMIVFMIFKWIRGIRRKKRSRLSTKLLKKIPTKKFKKGDAYDVCAICLDDYEEKDKLRILPCNHAYHCKCIDPWLTKNKKTCPVCKRKVIPGARSESESDSDEEENGNESSTERTPLLGAGNNNRIMTTPRRSAFETPALPQTAQPQLPQEPESSLPPVQAPTVATLLNHSSSNSSISSSEHGATSGIHSSQVMITPQQTPDKEGGNTSNVNEGYSSSSDSYTEDDDDSDVSDNIQVVVCNKDSSEDDKKTNHIV